MAEALTEIGTIVLELSGDLDMETAPTAREDGLEALAQPWLRGLVLDLGAVTFIGSAGLTVLVDLCQQAKAAGVEFSLARVPAKIYRVIQISGLADSFAITRADSV